MCMIVAKVTTRCQGNDQTANYNLLIVCCQLLNMATLSLPLSSEEGYHTKRHPNYITSHKQNIQER